MELNKEIKFFFGIWIPVIFLSGIPIIAIILSVGDLILFIHIIYRIIKNPKKHKQSEEN